MAAVAAWLLMLPPINRATGRIDHSGQLSASLWTTVGSYASLEACQKDQAQMAATLQDKIARESEMGQLETLNQHLEMSKASACVDSDDPRLKAN